MNERMAHFAAFGMIVLPSRALALQSISMITESIDGFDLLLINGEVVELRGEEATTFHNQTQSLARQIMFAGSGKR